MSLNVLTITTAAVCSAYDHLYMSRAGQHLHKQLAILQTLHSALPDYGCDVVLIVCQAVQGEGGIMLQVAISGRHELQQWRQAASLHIDSLFSTPRKFLCLHPLSAEPACKKLWTCLLWQHVSSNSEVSGAGMRYAPSTE